MNPQNPAPNPNMIQLTQYVWGLMETAEKLKAELQMTKERHQWSLKLKEKECEIENQKLQLLNKSLNIQSLVEDNRKKNDNRRR